MSEIYRLFKRIITNGRERKFESYQPKLQARLGNIEYIVTLTQSNM